MLTHINGVRSLTSHELLELKETLKITGDKAIEPVITQMKKRYSTEDISVRDEKMKKNGSCRPCVITIFIALVLMIGPTSPTNSKETLMPEDVQSIAHKSFVWGFPIVMNYKTMFNYVLDKENPEYKAPNGE